MGGLEVPGTLRPPLPARPVPACHGHGTPVLPVHTRTHKQCRLPVRFLILQTAPRSCCHKQGRQGSLCTPELEIGLGTGEGWSRHSRAPVRVVSLSQGAGCQGRLSAIAGAVNACLGACGGLLQVPIGAASLQGCFIAETPLPPQTETSQPQPRVPALPKGSRRDRAPAFH